MSSGARIMMSNGGLLSAAAAVREYKPDPRYFLRYLGDPVLHQVSTALASPKVIPEGLLPAMAHIMGQHRGAGLAAPQVGINVRICLVTLDRSTRILLNPRLTWRSKETNTDDQEGCLSIPEFFIRKSRHNRVTLEYEDIEFTPKKINVSGFEARCVQHEIDHLDGKLITDVSRQVYKAAKRRVDKLVRRK